MKNATSTEGRKARAGKRLTAIEALGYLRDDVKEMDWKELDDDQHTILVAKAEVLDFISDWIVYCSENQRG